MKLEDTNYKKFMILQILKCFDNDLFMKNINLLN